jgi:hypothetical protein
MGRQALAWRPIVRLGLAVLTIGAAACKSLGPAGPPPPSRQRDLLTREEILSSTAQQGDLLQAIHSLRPQFLAVPRGVYSRSSPTSAPIAVYIDRVRQSGVESLRSIAASKVAEVRYLEPTAALNEFGPTAGGGALLVTMFNPAKEPNGFGRRQISPAET